MNKTKLKNICILIGFTKMLTYCRKEKKDVYRQIAKGEAEIEFLYSVGRYNDRCVVTITTKDDRYWWPILMPFSSYKQYLTI